MADEGRDLWAHLLQFLHKQGHTQQGTQAHIQAAFEDLQGGDSTASGQLVPVFSCSRSAEVLPCAETKPGFLSMPLLLVLTPDTTGNGLAHLLHAFLPGIYKHW